MFKKIMKIVKSQDWFKSIFRGWNIRDYKWVFLLYPLGFYGIHLLLKITKMSMLTSNESADLELKLVTYLSIIITFLLLHYFIRTLHYFIKKYHPKSTTQKSKISAKHNSS